MIRRSICAIALAWWVASPVLAEKITSMAIHVKTGNVSGGGTDNDVALTLIFETPGGGGPPVTRSWNLDTPDHDDFESGNYEGFALSGPLPQRACEIKSLTISKSPDDYNGGWRLEFVELLINGKVFYKGVANRWLEDNSRTWPAGDFPNNVCPPPPVPPGINLGTAIPIPHCELTIIKGTVEFPEKVIEPDADCDGVPDKEDNTFSPPDSDQDGICDACEDFNQNGKVDPGETDPKKSDSDGDGLDDLDDLPDKDKDGLADIFEDKNRNGLQDAGETDWQNPDSDGDGWLDGFRNIRSTLYLTRIECLNEQEDIGDDELFLTFNHARVPSDASVDGSWELEGGDSVAPMLAVAHRTLDLSFSVRIDVREDDWFDFSDDDFILDKDQKFASNGSFILPYKDESFWDTTEYKFHFLAVQTWFADPSPLDMNGEADTDGDGITDTRERAVAFDLGGVADPQRPDIYMELDSVGKDQVPERFTREDIASRFTDHGFDFHLDDGTFGGGTVLPEEDSLSLKGPGSSVLTHRKTDFAASRCGVFHYAMAVDVVKIGDEKLFGKADRVIKDASGKTLCGFGDVLVFKSDYLDHVSDLESIVWIHELGHNLGLCHLPGDNEEVVSTTGGCSGSCPPKVSCNCVHYTNDRWNDSAMGSGFSFPWVDDLIQAIDREPDYDEKEWAVIDLKPIRGTGNCP
ncbi:MAG TPA: hypothetical protein VKB93_29060 [Thermoanaerobaculia bacterium]|nr:hypothetical protein [Thermoanaerobaculia bacterium]